MPDEVEPHREGIKKFPCGKWGHQEKATRREDRLGKKGRTPLVDEIIFKKNKWR